MIVLLSTKFQCLTGVEYFVFIFLFGLFVCIFLIFGELQRLYPKGFFNLMQHS